MPRPPAGRSWASDLGAAEAAPRWPAFAPAALQAGAAAIFVFPLRIGAIRAGVMGLYRARAGPLTSIPGEVIKLRPGLPADSAGGRDLGERQRVSFGP